MKDQLRDYIENLFAQAPKTAKAKEMKEELLADLFAKFDDLVAQGKSEEEAYKITIGGIGDINELIKDLENDKIYNYARKEEERKNSALLVSISVALYILGVAAVILCGIIGDEIGNDVVEEIGVVIMFLFAAGATGLLVYNGMSKTKYVKSDDTIVEKYKEQSKKIDNNTQVYKSIVATIWPLSVVIFFILGFFFDLFYIAWVVFIAMAGVQSIIKLMFEKKSRATTPKQLKNARHGIIWPFITTAYFIVSFATGAWFCTWLIFIIGVAVQALTDSIFEMRNYNEE